jgi:preprotein translocase subunit SecA
MNHSKESVVSLFSYSQTMPEVRVADDLIWLTQVAKLNGLVAQVQDWLAENRFALVLAHFPATLARVEQELSAAGVPIDFHDGRLSRKDVVPYVDQAIGRKALLVLAASLPSTDFPREINGTLGRLAIVVAERHFLREKDDAILSFAHTLGRPYEIAFHLSLHDPLMKHFAGKRVENELKRLGMLESTACESKMVARRIKGAQAKLSSRILSDRTADSAEQWLSLNLPDMAF